MSMYWGSLSVPRFIFFISLTSICSWGLFSYITSWSNNLSRSIIPLESLLVFSWRIPSTYSSSSSSGLFLIFIYSFVLYTLGSEHPFVSHEIFNLSIIIKNLDYAHVIQHRWWVQHMNDKYLYFVICYRLKSACYNF